MKRIIVAAMAACFVVGAFAIGASQEWVKRYVGQLLTNREHTDGVTVYKAGTGDQSVTVRVEDATVFALMATNTTASAVSQGVTNGMYFVWHEESHSYTNATQTITAAQDHLTWEEHDSVGAKFDGYFDVVNRLIQPSYAKEVTK